MQRDRSRHQQHSADKQELAGVAQSAHESHGGREALTNGNVGQQFDSLGNGCPLSSVTAGTKRGESSRTPIATIALDSLLAFYDRVIAGGAVERDASADGCAAAPAGARRAGEADSSAAPRRAARRRARRRSCAERKVAGGRAPRTTVDPARWTASVVCTSSPGDWASRKAIPPPAPAVGESG
jgi:hypothetical protein